MGSQRVRHDWTTFTFHLRIMHLFKQKFPTRFNSEKQRGDLYCVYWRMGCWGVEGEPGKLRHIFKVFFEKQNLMSTVFFYFSTLSMWNVLNEISIILIFSWVPKILKKKREKTYYLSVHVLCTLDLTSRYAGAKIVALWTVWAWK